MTNEILSIIYQVSAKSLQSFRTLCDPIDGSPPGSPVPGILRARTLEWVAIAFSNAWKWKVKVKSLSRVQLLATPWTAAYQAPPSMGFSRQEYWSGLPLPSPIFSLYILFKSIHLLNITGNISVSLNILLKDDFSDFRVHTLYGASLMAKQVKNLPSMQKTEEM